MKKLIATLLAIVMLAALSVSAIAATADNFTKSPSNTGAPGMTYDWTNPVGGCDPELAITPYKDRNTKSEEIKTAIEAAYNEIVHSQPSLGSLTITNGPLQGTNLMVSQLFDISFSDSEHTHTFGMNETHNATIKLTGDEVKNFMYLLHYTYTATPGTSTWEIVSCTRPTANTISFTVDSLSPFAIVVKNTSSGPSSPATGASAPIACAVGAVVFCVVGVALLKKSKEN